jgi:hypothetical protein
MSTKPIGPFRSRFFSDAYFLVSLLDEQDRAQWAVVPNRRGVGFVFTSPLSVHSWLETNGFLAPQRVLEVEDE